MWLFIEVSGQIVGPIFKGKAVQDECWEQAEVDLNRGERGRFFRKVSEPMALEHGVETDQEGCKQINARNLQTDLAFVSTQCIIET